MVVRKLKINTNIKSSFQGIYRWEVLTSKGDVVHRGRTENLILDALLNAIPTNSGNILNQNNGQFLNRLRVGTGSIPASVNDLGLVNEITNTTTKLTGLASAQLNPLDTTQLLESISIQFQFDLGAIDTTLSGAIRELGISDDSNRFISRVVISPGIEVTGDQQLRLTYEIRGLASINEREDFGINIPGLGFFDGNTANSNGKGIFNYVTYSRIGINESSFDNLEALCNPTQLSIFPTTTPIGSFAVASNNANTIAVTGAFSGNFGSSYTFINGTQASYTTGTFVTQVDFRYTSNNSWTTPAGGFLLRNVYMFKFDSGQSITKDDQTILDLSFTSSWGRL